MKIIIQKFSHLRILIYFLYVFNVLYIFHLVFIFTDYNNDSKRIVLHLIM